MLFYTYPPLDEEPAPSTALEHLLADQKRTPGLSGQLLTHLLTASVFIPDVVLRGHCPDRKLQLTGVLSVIPQEADKRPTVDVFTSLLTMQWGHPRLFRVTVPSHRRLRIRALLPWLNNGVHTLRINPGMATRLELGPEEISELVKMEAPAPIPVPHLAEDTLLIPVPAEKLPRELACAARAHCIRHRVPLGLYAFHPVDPATSTANTKELRLILWMKEEDSEFCDAFRKKVESVPQLPYVPQVSMIVGQSSPACEQLKSQTSLWPIQ